MSQLTIEEAWLQAPGTACPICQGTRLQRDAGFLHSQTEWWTYVTCCECGSKWTEAWDLVPKGLMHVVNACNIAVHPQSASENRLPIGTHLQSEEGGAIWVVTSVVPSCGGAGMQVNIVNTAEERGPVTLSVDAVLQVFSVVGPIQGKGV